MKETELYIKQVHEKLHQLLKQHQQLMKENNKLKADMQKMKDETTRQEKQVDELKQQLGILRMNSSGMGEKEKKEMEKQINVYLKEIDRCIAMLGA